MATGATLATDALIELGVYAPGETIASADQTFAVQRANDLIDTLQTEGLALLAQDEAIYLLTANKQSPTIGASGTFTATRPVKVTQANTIDLSDETIAGTTATTGAGDSILTDSGKNFTTEEVVAGRDLVYIISGTSVTAGIYRISTVGTTTLTLASNPGSNGSAIVYRVIKSPYRNPLNTGRDASWWAGLTERHTVGIPTDLFYNPHYPNGTLNIYPYSSDALGLELFTLTPLSAVTAGGTLSLAPAYYQLLMYNLALELCNPYGKKPAELLVLKAAVSRAKVKSLNSHPPRIVTNEGFA